MKYNNYFKIDVALLMFSIWSYVMSNAWMCIPYVVAFSCFGVYDFYKMNKEGNYFCMKS